MRCVWFLLQNSRLDNTPILAKPLLLHRKRNSKSGTPQTSTGSASKEGEFKFPEPLPPNRDSQWKPVRDVAETRSLSPEDAAQQLRNLKMDSISEGRRIGGPGPPTVLEVKSSVGVRWTYLLSLSLSSSCKFPFNFTPLRFTYHHHCSSLSNNQITKIGLMESDDYYDRIILSYCCTFTLWMNQLLVWLCLVTVKCLLRFDFLF